MSTSEYKFGRFEMSYNRASGNGINGLVVHKTDRARVVGNVLWDNGQTPKSAPESRQQYAGKWIKFLAPSGFFLMDFRKYLMKI